MDTGKPQKDLGYHRTDYLVCNKDFEEKLLYSKYQKDKTLGAPITS